MKNILLVIFLTIFGSLVYGQEIPNNKFESWISGGSYEEPENWDTPNAELSLLGQATVSKSNDAFAGNYSARLETKNVVLTDAPGLITLADFSVNITTIEFEISGGMALKENVSKLTGMYKYSGANNDSASVIIYNYKNTDGVIDTIGVGIKSLGDASEWTAFTVDMEQISTSIPDTFNVIIVSSGLNFQAGSVLLVDSLAIETNTGIISLDRKKEYINIFPNPATEIINLEMKTSSNNRSVFLFNLNGMMVKEVPFHEKRITIGVNDLLPGLYTFRVFDGKVNVTYGSFVVN
jgi:hypothetical protein